MARRAGDRQRGRAEAGRGEGDRLHARPPGRLKIIAALTICPLALVITALAIVAARGGQDTAVRAPAPRHKSAPAPVSGLPAPIAANIRQANQLIDTPIKTKLSALRGVPVVVNQWASWCPGCRAEFGFFQRLSRRYRSQVAFVGLDSQDTRESAREFLAELPLDFPSVFDPSASQAASIGAGQAWPTTVFFNRSGRRTFVRPGAYTTLESLDADIRRYALAG